MNSVKGQSSSNSITAVWDYGGNTFWPVCFFWLQYLEWPLERKPLLCSLSLSPSLPPFRLVPTVRRGVGGCWPYFHWTAEPSCPSWLWPHWRTDSAASARSCSSWPTVAGTGDQPPLPEAFSHNFLSSSQSVRPSVCPSVCCCSSSSSGGHLTPLLPFSLWAPSTLCSSRNAPPSPGGASPACSS